MRRVVPNDAATAASAPCARSATGFEHIGMDDFEVVEFGLGLGGENGKRGGAQFSLRCARRSWRSPRLE